MATKVAYVNPISAGLHPIPQECPFCGEQQYDGKTAIGGITDYKLEDGTWSVCHVTCQPEVS